MMSFKNQTLGCYELFIVVFGEGLHIRHSIPIYLISTFLPIVISYFHFQVLAGWIFQGTFSLDDVPYSFGFNIFHYKHFVMFSAAHLSLPNFVDWQ
jgi:accessory gene regulator protein AgrB